MRTVMIESWIYKARIAKRSQVGKYKNASGAAYLASDSRHRPHCGALIVANRTSLVGAPISGYLCPRSDGQGAPPSEFGFELLSPRSRGGEKRIANGVALSAYGAALC
ncbi:MAG: hypothetical protein QG604_20 [Candidatus Dependentiae bacterium]|nr:hypothetical protein [Candidatus Dependentiae bacterium]